MSQFGGTALAALAQGSQNQQAQAGTISDVQGLAQRGFAQRGQISGQAAATASQGLAAAGRTQQAGLRTLQAGADSVQGAFSQLFQAKFQRDMERERADRQFRIEDGRKKTAELNDLNRIIGTLQEGVAIGGAAIPSGTPEKLSAPLQADLSRRQQLLGDAQRIRQDLLDGVAGARGGAHAIAGRFIRGAEATAQVDVRFQEALNARGGFGLREDNRRIERLQRHETMVARSVQLGIVSDLSSIATTLKKGDLTDVQLAQKLMSSAGVPQTARMSDIVDFLVGGDGSKEDREERLSQFQSLADSGTIDTSTLRGILGGLEALIELGPNSLVAAAGEADMSPEDRQQLTRVALQLREGFNLLEMSLPGVTEGMKRDRVEIWRQALINGHPDNVETQTKVFKALDDAQTLAPQLIKLLTTGVGLGKAAAVSAITELAGLGPSGEQGGDLIKASLDATKQVGGSVGSIVPEPIPPGRDFVQEGLERVGIPGAGPEAGPTEIAARGAATVLGETANLLSPGVSELFSQSLGSGRQNRRFSIERADSKTKSGKRTLRNVVNEAQIDRVITKAQATRLKGRIEKGTLEGTELLAFFDGIRKRRNR